MQYTNFTGDLDNDQFQSNILHDIANDTVAPLGVENVAYYENNNVHRMNNREWTEEQRHRIVDIDTKERTRETIHEKSKRKMGHQISKSFENSKNLINSAYLIKGRFRKEGLGRPAMEKKRWLQLRYPLQKTKKEDILNGRQR